MIVIVITMIFKLSAGAGLPRPRWRSLHQHLMSNKYVNGDWSKAPLQQSGIIKKLSQSVEYSHTYHQCRSGLNFPRIPRWKGTTPYYIRTRNYISEALHNIFQDLCDVEMYRDILLKLISFELWFLKQRYWISWNFGRPLRLYFFNF